MSQRLSFAYRALVTSQKRPNPSKIADYSCNKKISKPHKGGNIIKPKLTLKEILPNNINQVGNIIEYNQVKKMSASQREMIHSSQVPQLKIMASLGISALKNFISIKISNTIKKTLLLQPDSQS